MSATSEFPAGGREAHRSTELAAALTALDQFDVLDLRSGTDDEVCRMLADAEAVSRRLSAIQLAGAAEVADRSRPELGSEGIAQRHAEVKPAAFLEKLLRVSNADAARRVNLGSALRGQQIYSGEIMPAKFPALADAVLAGDVGPDAAASIVRALDGARRAALQDDLEAAEAGLVEFARANTVDDVAELGRRVRDHLDPDGVLPREQETRLRRAVQLGRERNGIVPISGGLAPLDAALVKSAFDEANAPGAQPRFLSEQDRRDGTLTTVAEDGTETVTLRDTRTREQRQHDVLVGLLKAGIRNTGLEAGQIRSTAEVVAHISLADLESGKGFGYLDGMLEPVSAHTIAQLMCDASFRRVLLGNDGEIIALGKARYPFTSAQKKALVARDGDTCVLCSAPACWVDVHHVAEYWTHGAVGRTDVDNGVILCPRHHALFHLGAWKLRMVDGIPHVLAPFGIDPSQAWRRVGKSKLRLPQLE